MINLESTGFGLLGSLAVRSRVLESAGAKVAWKGLSDCIESRVESGEVPRNTGPGGCNSCGNGETGWLRSCDETLAGALSTGWNGGCLIEENCTAGGTSIYLYLEGS